MQPLPSVNTILTIRADMVIPLVFHGCQCGQNTLLTTSYFLRTIVLGSSVGGKLPMSFPRWRAIL